MNYKKLHGKNLYLKQLQKIIFIIIIFTFIFKFNSKIILEYPKFILNEYRNIFDLLKKKNFYLLNKETNIESIFILIIVFPFLKNEIIITKRNSIYKLFIKYFNFKNNGRIKLNQTFFSNFSNKLEDFLNYKWEKLLNRNNTNYLRHILYHYYSEECLKIYEKSLNMNIKYYLGNNKLSHELIIDLMSKPK